MTRIRPISDLRNKYTEIETDVQSGEPVFLTKNGYGSLVVMSLEHYDALTDSIEQKLDYADLAAKSSSKRLTHEEVFGSLRKEISDRKIQA